MRTLAWHVAQLFIAFAVSFIGVFVWFALPTCTAGYRHHMVRSQVHRIESILHSDYGIISGTEFTVDEINDWLAGLSPNADKIAAEWGMCDEHDSWHRPLRCKQVGGTCDNSRPMLGVYSLGEDGLSNSEGDDPDDINTWNRNSNRYYEHRIFTQQMLLILGSTAFFGLPIYLFLAGIKVVADNDPYWRDFWREGGTLRFSLFHVFLVFPAFFLGMTLASCFFWYAEGFWLPKLILGAILTGYCYMVLLAGRYIVLPRRSAALPKTGANAAP